MVALIVIIGVTLTLGFLVWFSDRRHHKYGILALPGISLGSALLLWIVLQFAGLGYNPDLFWASRLLPILVSAALTVAAAWWLGRHREQADLNALNEALKN